jgi:hypothetical protein
MPTFNEAFQFIVDNASALSINGRGVVAQTQTRTGVVRTVSRGGRVWRFTVTPAAGSRYVDARPYISRLDQMDRIQPAEIDFDRTEFNSIVGYLGSGSGTFTATVPAGTGVTQITLSSSVSPGAGYVVRAGDWIQLGTTGSVYQVVTDPATGNSVSVTLNRPVDEAAGAYTARIGPAVRWQVLCVDMPTWRLVPAGAQQIVEWSGDFVFIEDRT